jgi:carboxyl-terminal processing protease
VVVIEETHAQSAVIKATAATTDSPAQLRADLGQGVRSSATDIKAELASLWKTWSALSRTAIPAAVSAGRQAMAASSCPPTCAGENRLGKAQPWLIKTRRCSGTAVSLVVSTRQRPVWTVAMQDYRRGIVMGSTTYGKGTVVQVFDLDNAVTPEAVYALGSLKPRCRNLPREWGSTQFSA